MYDNLTLKGLKLELKSYTDNLSQYLKEERSTLETITTLDKAFKDSQDDIYLIRANIKRNELIFTRRITKTSETHIQMLNEAIEDFKEPNYRKNNTFITMGLCTDMEVY